MAHYPTKTVSYNSVAEFNSAVAKILNAMGIYSRTSHLKVGIRFSIACGYKSDEDFEERFGVEVPSNFAMYISQTLRSIRYAYDTGRLHIEAEKHLNELSGYQLARMVVKIALCRVTMHHTVGYLNGRESLTLPIAA